ncbi:hypothetical protein [Roseateles saccharophilus]|uniref:Uncharacterized protein n=1 Tax=Roseateles saccharophilus TaxID=304 RepID=A0A4R3U942_ROSSA|nr:hypothetical protein [Roseateles saccharophilus]MDG0835786.1 hypothetical protein [Roseateles saccharophilus]TCU83738.1 hypothetical protein EV671_10562 [Roseateles saccharophilus]
MIGRHLTDDGLVSLHWDNPDGPDVLAEIRRTSTARDVREGLLALAYAVDSAARPATGLCVIVDSRLSMPRLEAELSRFRSIVRPEVAHRIHLVGAKTGPNLHLNGEVPEFPQPFLRALYGAVQDEGMGNASTRVTRQQVKAVLVERALCGLAPMTLAEMRRQTGASYQTASAALTELLQLNIVAGERDGPIDLWLKPKVLLKLADEHAAARKELRYADPSGLSRMPSAMAERLLSLRSKGVAEKVAISGVLGALHFLPDLNITASPRLDLSVYDGDLRFVPKLDAGLVDADATKRKPLLVLHLQRDCRPPESIAREPELAARLDCLADLEQLGLQAEAEELAHELCEAARKAP